MRLVLKLSIALFVALSLPTADARSSRPLTDILTYRDFTDLVKESTSKIPELQEIWKWQRKTGAYVYFGGGCLRGLLHWLYIQLQNHTIEEVRSMRVPHMDDLQLQKGSDLDLFAPDDLIDTIKHDLPRYKDWDIISDTSHSDNLILGGPTLEKIRVNPNYFDDPLEGLRDYYEGRLVFHMTSERKFRKLYWVAKKGNTKTTEALRFIRFTYDLPELRADSDSISLIRQIAEIETPIITEKNSKWISKALLKAHNSTGNNLVRTLKALRKYNLLSLLGYHGFRIPGRYDFSDYISTLRDLGFSTAEIKSAARMVVSRNKAGRTYCFRILDDRTRDARGQ